MPCPPACPSPQLEWSRWSWGVARSPAGALWSAMAISFNQLERSARLALAKAGADPEVSERSGAGCAWLEACGYKGIAMLLEALDETPREQMNPPLELKFGGIDGGGISAVFLAPALMRFAARQGRITYRNARHGLYLLPFTVEANIGIGCPVDPAFHIGGEREKNPYAEKLALAAANGLSPDPALWDGLTARG
jgi:hypothetical protein